MDKFSTVESFHSPVEPIDARTRKIINLMRKIPWAAINSLFSFFFASSNLELCVEEGGRKSNISLFDTDVLMYVFTQKICQRQSKLKFENWQEKTKINYIKGREYYQAKISDNFHTHKMYI